MKYLFYKNMSIIKNKTWKILIGYFIFIISLIVFTKFVNLDDEFFNVADLLGLSLIKHKHILFILARLLKISIYTYLVFKVFVDDLLFSSYNTFLRFNRKRWIINKIFSILLVILILKILEYTLTIMFINCNILDLVNLFVVDLFNSWAIMSLVIFIYLLKGKTKFIMLLLLCVVFPKYLLINAYDIKKIFFLVFIFIANTLSYYKSKNILKD